MLGIAGEPELTISGVATVYRETKPPDAVRPFGGDRRGEGNFHLRVFRLHRKLLSVDLEDASLRGDRLRFHRNRPRLVIGGNVDHRLDVKLRACRSGDGKALGSRPLARGVRGKDRKISENGLRKLAAVVRAEPKSHGDVCGDLDRLPVSHRGPEL